jgi:hypothetical protein
MVGLRHSLPRNLIAAPMMALLVRPLLVAGCLLGTSLLMGCDSVRLPPSGFATRYVMSWMQNGKTGSAGSPSEFLTYPNEPCRNLAQTRVSDAALSLSFEPSRADRRKMFALTYADCIKWHGK